MSVTGYVWLLLTSAEKMAILYHAVIQNCRRWEKKKTTAATVAEECHIINPHHNTDGAGR